MSKLADAIKRSQRTEATPMGFGAARPAPKPTLLTGFLGAAADIETARDAGAELLIVDAHPAGLGKLLGASPELPADAFKAALDGAQSPGGIFTDPDVEGVKALKERGFDFVVFEPGGTPAAALLDEELGYVLALPSSAEDATLRAFASLQLDAVYFGDMPSPLTVAKQADLMRAASLTGKPLLVRVEAGVSNEDLQCLRGAGVAGVLAGTPDAVAKVKETVAALPARKTRRDENRPVVSLPRSGGAAEEHDHDDDDD
jgi:hypothetical protein